ncbi:MAG: nucleotide-binding protein [Microbacterium gubbeenense]|uniref:nucleotide-binding protein n=1 Tax=Microbacterium gubbeenense TaxID=159896 RepID=UPI003F9A6779
MSALVAAGEPHGSRIASALAEVGVEVTSLVRPDELIAAVSDASSPVWQALREADSVVLHATRAVLAPEIIAMCDRSGARIIALADRAAERRAVAAFGLPAALPLDADGTEILAAIETRVLGPDERADERPRGSVTVVWGPNGAPGRTTVALALSASLAAAGSRVALVDADTHAPSIAQRLDLPEEAPGFPAACRQTDYGVLDGPELTRLSAPVDIGEHPLEVLTGINRPTRWPELSAGRVAAALDVARDWSDHVVVDIGAPLETDEEIVSDIGAPRRNQAALAALTAADTILAVAAADPVGIARIVRGLARLDEVAPAAERRVVVNRMRQAPFGIDATQQVRRALDQYAPGEETWFLPDDRRAADDALRRAAPILSRRRAGFSHALGALAATL